MAQIPTIDEEKKKREAEAAASGNTIVSPQANSVAGSRPAIYEGQPATGESYGNAARALVGSLPPVFNAEERVGPSTKPSVVGQMVSNVVAGEQSKLKALNQFDDLPKASYSNEGRVAQKPVTATAPSVVSTEQATAAAAEQAIPTTAQAPISPTADLHARSNEQQALVSFGQKQAADRGVSIPTAIATDAGVRNTFNAAQEAGGTGIMYGATTGADGKPQMSISGGEPTKAQYIDANGQPTNDYTKTAQYAQGIATAGRLQAMADKIPDHKGPTGYVIQDQNKADREALFAKWDRENMADKVGRMDVRNSAAVANLVGQGYKADSERRGQDFQREAQAGNLAVAQQDSATRASAAASTAGLQSSQSQGIMADVETKTNLVALQNRAASGDKQAIDALRAMRGQGRDANFKGLHAAGGSSIDPSTGQVVKSPDNVVIYNEQTGQIQQLGAGGQGAAGKAPVVGEVRGGYKFKGGNPADKAAWEKV